MDLIGLQAMFQDAQFQQGIAGYGKAVTTAEKLTDNATGVLSKMGAVAGGALVIGFGAATAAAGALVAVSKIGIDALTSWNDSVNTLSDNLGTTGAQSSAWAVAFEHVGLSVEEGGAGLNFFVKNLGALKNVQTGATQTTAKNADAIAGLNQRLEDANVRLQRAQKTLAESEKPTDGMRYAVEDAQKAVARLNAELGDATRIVPGAAAKLTPFQEALKKLGVSAFDSHGNLRTFDALMPDLLDSFQKMPAGVNKSALAMDLFGARAGTKFLDFLSQGSEGLEKARELAKLYGLELDTDFSNAVEDFGFAVNDSNLALKGMWVTVGKQVLPVVSKFVSLVNTKLVPPLMGLVKKVAPAIGGALDKAFFIFEDLIGLFSGEDKLPQLAKNIGDLFNVFGQGDNVTNFILGIGKFITNVTPTVQSFVNILKLLATGNFEGGIFGLSEDTALINFLLTARDTVIDLWDALKVGDWSKAWFTLTDGLGNLGGIANEALTAAWENSIKPQLLQWGTDFWFWIQHRAIPAAKAEFNKLRDGIVEWVHANGPIAWSQLVQWGTDFWFWLTNPADGAVGKAAGKFNEFIALISPELAKVGPAAWDLANLWGGQFWDWLTADGGALDQLGPKMIEVTAAFEKWTRATDWGAVGEAIVEMLIEGIQFSDDGSDTNPAIERFIKSLEVSIGNSKDALANIGGDLAEGIANGLTKWLTGKENTDATRAQIQAWLTAIFKGITFGDMSGVPPLLQPQPTPTVPSGNSGFGSLSGPTGGGLQGLLPTGTGMGGSTVPAANAFQRGGGGGGSGAIQAIPMNLQVLIGQEEIQNAQLNYTYTAVEKLIGEAQDETVKNLPH